MSKNWKLKSEISRNISDNLSEYGELTARLLFNRGLTDEYKIDEFLNPKYENLYDPFLFVDMQKAVDRIWLAINENQKICIYGDYDADAVTANAVLRQTFRYLGVEALSYIPDRFTEGYGINIEALEKIRDGGCKLIITVDCGTNSTDAAVFCLQNNIDLIITDHHELIGEIPKAYALINPKNPDDNYPYREITGVGVAFKLACGILSNKQRVSPGISSHPALPPPGTPPYEGGEYKGGWEKWLLDLVAIGTVADCHALLGENRILVKYGLKVLAKTRWPGLRALMISSGLIGNIIDGPPSRAMSNKKFDTHTLGFIIAPRLNAAGRLEHANIALDLLMEQDDIAAQQKAFALEEINRKRQNLTETVLSEAREQALKYQDRKVLVLLGEDWPKGVVGLVAGRIAEEFGKPAIVLNKEAAGSTGSARAVGEFNVIEALKFASAHLIKFGGHRQAAGLTLKTDEYEQFYRAILDYAEANLPAGDLQRQLNLEAELSSRDISLDTLKLLEAFEPFGVGNPKPKFLIRNLKIAGSRLVGSLQKHLQLQLSTADNNGTIPAIMFNCGDFAKSLKVGDTVDVAAELIEDGWNGRKDIKLRIVDLKRV